MKNLIILSVLLLIAVSGYAQSISGELNSEYAKAMKPVPSAFSAFENTTVDNTTGIQKAEAEFEQALPFVAIPSFSGIMPASGDQGGGPIIVNPDKVKTGNYIPAVPANDINVPFENVPQKEENNVPEKAGEAL
jgi:hypothetical protein